MRPCSVALCSLPRRVIKNIIYYPVQQKKADFRDRHRLTRPKFDILLHMIEADLQHPTGRNQSLSPALQLAVGLRFYACGSFQQVVGDTANMHKSTVCRSISRVTDAIVKRKSMFLSWPSEEELQENANLICNRSRLPNVCGLIDGTHIQLKRPHAHEESYVNRKGVHSINQRANYKFEQLQNYGCVCAAAWIITWHLGIAQLWTVWQIWKRYFSWHSSRNTVGRFWLPVQLLANNTSVRKASSNSKHR